ITLGAIVFGLTALAIVWLASSVAVDLYGSHGAPRPANPASGTPWVFSGEASDLGGQLRCQLEVEVLFDQLNTAVGRLAEAGGPRQTDLRHEFEERWVERWRSVGERCRFRELRDRKLGTAFDHLAWVHAELSVVHRGYAALLESYVAQHGTRVQELRRALETSRTTLERQAT